MRRHKNGMVSYSAEELNPMVKGHEPVVEAPAKSRRFKHLPVSAEGTLHPRIQEELREIFSRTTEPVDVEGFFPVRAFLKTALLRLDFSLPLQSELLEFHRELLDREEFTSLVRSWLSSLPAELSCKLPSLDKGKSGPDKWLPRIFAEKSQVGESFRLACFQGLERNAERTRAREIQAPVLEALQRDLSLDGTDAILLGLALCMRIHYDMRAFASPGDDAGLVNLASLAGLGVHEFIQRLGKNSRLRLLGLINLDDDEFELVFAHLTLFRTLSWNKLIENCLEPADSSPFALDSFGVETGKINILLALLKSGSPCNVLIHGLPGTGKSQLARSLSHATGRRAIALAPGEDLTGGSSSSAARISMVFQKIGPDNLLIVDEAEPYLESVMASPFGGMMDVESKAFINQLLDSGKIQVIWIINEISCLHESTLRRFDYLLKMPTPGAKRREVLWQDLAGRKSLGIPADSIDKLWSTLARQYDLSPGLIDRTLKTLSCLDEVNESTIHTVLGGYLEAGIGKNLHPKSSGEWCPDALNCSPTSQKIVEYCTRNKNPEIRMLFHGAPGTGKTEMVQQLARILDFELLQIQASDIMSKYVGETESNIRDCFARAARPRTILLVDEIDSFLQNREGMQRSWEVSQVNEFLTGLENFRGFFTGTTNSLERLDPAVIRRFGIKVAFDYLKPEGCRALRERYFPDFAGDLDWSRLPPLCPSDFGLASRAAFRPANLEELETFLRAEAALRKNREGDRRVIGFTA